MIITLAFILSFVLIFWGFMFFAALQFLWPVFLVLAVVRLMREYKARTTVL